jgi:hypothetical protein
VSIPSFSIILYFQTIRNTNPATSSTVLHVEENSSNSTMDLNNAHGDQTTADKTMINSEEREVETSIHVEENSSNSTMDLNNAHGDQTTAGKTMINSEEREVETSSPALHLNNLGRELDDVTDASFTNFLAKTQVTSYVCLGIFSINDTNSI